MTKNIQKKKSPGGQLLIHKVKRKNKKSHCRICGKLLQITTNKGTKSGKLIARKYGGEICHACLRTVIQSLNL